MPRRIIPLSRGKLIYKNKNKQLFSSQYIAKRENTRTTIRVRVKELYENYSKRIARKLGIVDYEAKCPPINIVKSQRYYAKVFFTDSKPLRVNINEYLLDYYEIDPKQADIVLKYFLAHEVAHVIQRRKYGKEMYKKPIEEIEKEAERLAREVSGISLWQFEKASLSLHEKYLEKHYKE
jgi:hypothetical protein